MVFTELAEINMFRRKQILPLGNVRIFRIIRKTDIPFLKMCVFFAELTEINIFHRNYDMLIDFGEAASSQVR